MVKWSQRGLKQQNKVKPSDTNVSSTATIATEGQASKVTVTGIPSAEERAKWYSIEPVQMPKAIAFLCRYTILYETLMVTLQILNLALFPYDCFFNVHDPVVAGLVYAMNFIFSIDVIIRLLVEEWRHKNQVRCLVFMCK